ncbi:NAD(P)-binding protein [Duganella sp. FT134W]|uniref:NAD(P)-binding protein n=1 Tax=Duganella margarita TaxID=2692170 RepID=A0A7X4H4V3_9BURK|nr:NAD(P)-binding protein [Duganella margarita]
MKANILNLGVIGAGLAGMSCARHLQSDLCKVTMFDGKRLSPGGVELTIRQSMTICDIWHEEGWRLASLESGTLGEVFDALVLALPAAQASALLAPLLPATAMQVASMEPSADHCIWLPAVQVGVCGGWLRGDHEGDAWLSGRALAARMLRQRTAAQNSVEAVRPKVRGAPSTR